MKEGVISNVKEGGRLHRVEEFKAVIIKEGEEVKVSVKIVFYHLSHPICSVSIDEDFKQQVENNLKESQRKEKVFASHFSTVLNKF